MGTAVKKLQSSLTLQWIAKRTPPTNTNISPLLLCSACASQGGTPCQPGGNSGGGFFAEVSGGRWENEHNLKLEQLR